MPSTGGHVGQEPLFSARERVGERNTMPRRIKTRRAFIDRVFIRYLVHRRWRLREKRVTGKSALSKNDSRKARGSFTSCSKPAESRNSLVQNVNGLFGRKQHLSKSNGRAQFSCARSRGKQKQTCITAKFMHKGH
jgi:hypothetical protein